MASLPAACIRNSAGEQMFFGESMVTRLTNGSKVAVAALMHLAPRKKISSLLDCQVSSPHIW